MSLDNALLILGVNCPSFLSQLTDMRPKTQLKLNGAK